MKERQGPEEQESKVKCRMSGTASISGNVSGPSRAYLGKTLHLRGAEEAAVERSMVDIELPDIIHRPGSSSSFFSSQSPSFLTG